MIQKLSKSLLCLIAIPTFLTAQIEIPSLSPTVKKIHEFALTEVTFTYSAPSARDRKIFGIDALISNGDYWRTGANKATKITFKSDTYVMDSLLPKGEYTILTIPGAEHWKVNLYQYQDSDWTAYKDQLPIFSNDIKPIRQKDYQETLQLGLEGTIAGNANIFIEWADTKISIPIHQDIHDGIMKKIDYVMEGTSLTEYFQAAVYLHDSQIQLERALKYVRIVNASPRAWFFHHYREALILKDLKRNAEAKTTAIKSKQMAIKEGDMDFAKLCDALLSTL